VIRARAYVASVVCVACTVAAAGVRFGRDGLTAGLVCVALLAFVVASKWAKVGN